MKRVWFLVPMLVFLISAPAYAQEDGAAPEEVPVLRDASISVLPDQGGVDISERIELSNIEDSNQGEIEHIVTKLGDAEIEDLSVTAGDQELMVERAEGDLLDRIVVSLPEGADEDFSYEISYRYPEIQDSNRVPMVVPTLTSGAVENNVSLEMEIPEGQYLHSSFPLIDSGDIGTVSANMVSFPNYVSFVLGGSPVGIFTSANLYTALTFAVILSCVVGLLLFDRKSGEKTRSRGVMDV